MPAGNGGGWRVGLRAVLMASALLVVFLLYYTSHREEATPSLVGPDENGLIHAHPPGVRRDLFAYQDHIIKDVLQLGQVTDSNFYRWSVIKRLLQDDQRKRGGKDPFVVLEYGSNLGSISIPLASTFPLATVISVESGDVDPAQRHSLPYEVKVMGKVKFHEQVLTTLGVDNNAVCKASVSMAMLQRLQTARVRFDFQLLLDFVHHIDADSFEELSAFLRALVPLARVTVIEIPRVDADAADANAWFSKGSAIQTVREALSLLPYTRVDSLVGGRQTIQLIAIENTAVSEGLALAPGHAFCQQAFDVLRCENELQSAWCPGTAGANAQQGGGGGGRGAVNLRPDAIRHGGSKQQQQQEQESKSKVTTTTTTTRRRPTTTKKVLKRIPTSACGRRQGMVVELIPECRTQRPQSEWTWENDGWYKCRNATHWLTGCMHMP